MESQERIDATSGAMQQEKIICSCIIPASHTTLQINKVLKPTSQSAWCTTWTDFFKISLCLKLTVINFLCGDIDIMVFDSY